MSIDEGLKKIYEAIYCNKKSQLDSYKLLLEIVSKEDINVGLLKSQLDRYITDCQCQMRMLEDKKPDYLRVLDEKRSNRP